MKRLLAVLEAAQAPEPKLVKMCDGVCRHVDRMGAFEGESVTCSLGHSFCLQCAGPALTAGGKASAGGELRIRCAAPGCEGLFGMREIRRLEAPAFTGAQAAALADAAVEARRLDALGGGLFAAAVVLAASSLHFVKCTTPGCAATYSDTTRYCSAVICESCGAITCGICYAVVEGQPPGAPASTSHAATQFCPCTSAPTFLLGNSRRRGGTDEELQVHARPSYTPSRPNPRPQEDKDKQFRVALAKQTLRLLQGLSSPAAVLRAPEVLSAATVHGLDLSRPTLLPDGDEVPLHVRWAFHEIAQGRLGVPLSPDAVRLAEAEQRLMLIIDESMNQPRFGRMGLDACDACNVHSAVARAAAMLRDGDGLAAEAEETLAILRAARDLVVAAGGDGVNAVGELEAAKRLQLYYDVNVAAWGPFGYQWRDAAKEAVVAARRGYKESIMRFTEQLIGGGDAIAVPWARRRRLLEPEARGAWDAQLSSVRCGDAVLDLFLLMEEEHQSAAAARAAADDEVVVLDDE